VKLALAPPHLGGGFSTPPVVPTPSPASTSPPRWGFLST
jgi:hypothetical protein